MVANILLTSCIYKCCNSNPPPPQLIKNQKKKRKYKKKILEENKNIYIHISEKNTSKRPRNSWRLVEEDQNIKD